MLLFLFVDCFVFSIIVQLHVGAFCYTLCLAECFRAHLSLALLCCPLQANGTCIISGGIWLIQQRLNFFLWSSINCWISYAFFCFPRSSLRAKWTLQNWKRTYTSGKAIIGGGRYPENINICDRQPISLSTGKHFNKAIFSPNVWSRRKKKWQQQNQKDNE